MHRFIFHFEKLILPNGIHFRVFHFCLHGIHHSLPLDMDRIVFPPAVGVIILSILFSILYCFNPNDTSFIILSGFDTGYILYDMFHYFMHKADIEILKKKRRIHNIHHFKGM